jgi:hypothetical protein
VAERLDGPDLEPQVPQLRLVGEDVVLEVDDLLLEVEDARGGGLGAVDEEGMEMLGGFVSGGLHLCCEWEKETYVGLFFARLQLLDDCGEFEVEFLCFPSDALGHVPLSLGGLLGCFQGLVGCRGELGIRVGRGDGEFRVPKCGVEPREGAGKIADVLVFDLEERY